MRSVPLAVVVLCGLALALFPGCGGGGGGGDGPLPTVSVGDAGIAEGDDGTTALTFTVTLSAAATGDVSVAWTTTDGSAQADVDYAAASGNLTLPAGSTTGTIAVDVLGDTVWEGDETFSVVLSNPTGATLGTATGTATVTDDDPPGAPTLVVSDGGIQTLHFTWAAVPGATHYRLLEDPDGLSGFAPVGTDLTAGTTAADHRVAVHLTDWLGARYRLEACNDFGCTPSAPIDVTPVMLDAIGYVKASNTGATDEFGLAVAVSGDGDTMAIGARYEDGSSPGVNGADNDATAVSGAVYVFVRSGST